MDVDSAPHSVLTLRSVLATVDLRSVTEPLGIGPHFPLTSACSVCVRGGRLAVIVRPALHLALSVGSFAPSY